MAKKAELLAEAKKLKLDVNGKNTIAEIEAAINEVANKKQTKSVATKTETKDRKTSTAGGDTDGNTQENSETTDKADDKGQEKVAKAGKRSAKALKEAEELEAKEARKAGDKEEEQKPSKPVYVQKTRSKLERAGKKYRKASDLLEIGKEHSAKEALELAVKTSTTKFNGTVELHARLNVDPKHADQNIRETIVLPAGTGKPVRVAVFGEPDDVATAKKAGADVAGADEFLQQLDKEQLDFDVLIATPAVMAKLGKYARVLGPKGLMPNPKSGTVTNDIAKAVEQAKAGRVEFRVDEAGIIHLGIGKVSFGADKLYDNLQAVFASIKAAKPASVKGNLVRTLHVTTTMGPSIKISISEM